MCSAHRTSQNLPIVNTMANKHKLIFAGFFILISAQWTVCASGKDLLHIDTALLHQKRMLLDFILESYMLIVSKTQEHKN